MCGRTIRELRKELADETGRCEELEKTVRQKEAKERQLLSKLVAAQSGNSGPAPTHMPSEKSAPGGGAIKSAVDAIETKNAVAAAAAAAEVEAAERTKSRANAAAAIEGVLRPKHTRASDLPKLIASLGPDQLDPTIKPDLIALATFEIQFAAHAQVTAANRIGAVFHRHRSRKLLKSGVSRSHLASANGIGSAGSAVNSVSEQTATKQKLAALKQQSGQDLEHRIATLTASIRANPADRDSNHKRMLELAKMQEEYKNYETSLVQHIERLSKTRADKRAVVIKHDQRAQTFKKALVGGGGAGATADALYNRLTEREAKIEKLLSVARELTNSRRAAIGMANTNTASTANAANAAATENEIDRRMREWERERKAAEAVGGAGAAVTVTTIKVPASILQQQQPNGASNTTAAGSGGVAAMMAAMNGSGEGQPPPPLTTAQSNGTGSGSGAAFQFVSAANLSGPVPVAPPGLIAPQTPVSAGAGGAAGLIAPRPSTTTTQPPIQPHFPLQQQPVSLLPPTQPPVQPLQQQPVSLLPPQQQQTPAPIVPPISLSRLPSIGQPPQIIGGTGLPLPNPLAFGSVGVGVGGIPQAGTIFNPLPPQNTLSPSQAQPTLPGVGAFNPYDPALAPPPGVDPRAHLAMLQQQHAAAQAAQLQQLQQLQATQQAQLAALQAQQQVQAQAAALAALQLQQQQLIQQQQQQQQQRASITAGQTTAKPVFVAAQAPAPAPGAVANTGPRPSLTNAGGAVITPTNAATPKPATAPPAVNAQQQQKAVSAAIASTAAPTPTNASSAGAGEMVMTVDLRLDAQCRQLPKRSSLMPKYGALIVMLGNTFLSQSDAETYSSEIHFKTPISVRFTSDQSKQHLIFRLCTKQLKLSSGKSFTAQDMAAQQSLFTNDQLACVGFCIADLKLTNGATGMLTLPFSVIPKAGDPPQPSDPKLAPLLALRYSVRREPIAQPFSSSSGSAAAGTGSAAAASATTPRK